MKLFVIKNTKTNKYVGNSYACNVKYLSKARIFDEKYVKEYEELVKMHGMTYKNEKFV